MKVEEIGVYEVINSRTNKTVAAEVNGKLAFAPSGASAGTYEASSFVPEKIKRFESDLKEKIEGRDLDQKGFDEALIEYDGSKNLEKIGSIGIALSLAFKLAKGYEKDVYFPYPLGNAIGGGEHGGNTAIQEFLILPVEAESFPEAIEINSKIYREFKERYSQKIMGMNDEGALVTKMNDEETLKKLYKVAEKYGARLGLDMAANELWNGEEYVYPELGMNLSPKQQLKFVKKIIDEYDLYYVEDPFHEDDYDNHKKLTVETGCLIVGDDLFVTNERRLGKGIEKGSCNSLIVKPNQVGSVSKTYKTIEKAVENDYIPVVSHRSGETCDTSISRMALEKKIPIIKAGIADIRISKLNKLLLEWQRMEKKGENPKMGELTLL